MSQKHEFFYRMIIILLTVILVITLVQSPRATQAAPQAAGAQMLAVTIFNVSCISIPTATTTYAKLTDLGTFTVHSPDSLVELTYNGRISIESNSTDAGSIFELRVDDVTSTIGRARAVLKDAEVGDDGVQVSITGFFNGLQAGNHTASMWVRTSLGTATKPRVDTGCWSTDVLIVREHLPFGVSFLPMITK